MARLLLLNDNSDQENWGAQAIPFAIVRILNEHIQGLSVKSFSNSWLRRQFRRLHAIPALNVTYEVHRRGRSLPSVAEHALAWLSTPEEFFPRVADDFEFFGDLWESGRAGPMGKEFLEAVNDADVVVHNGENSVYRNTVDGCRALFLLWLSKARLRRPTCAINQTTVLASVPRPVMPGMARLVYPLLDVVTVREPYSLRDLHALGVQNTQLVPDAVFYLDETPDASKALGAWRQRVGLGEGPYFCLSGSALPMSEPCPGWDGAVAELITQLKRILPQAVLMAKDPPARFLERVARATGSIYFGPEHSFQELWPLLRGARLLVSGYFHHILVASLVGCPFIPLSANNHKMDGLLEYLNWHTRRPYDATAVRYCMESILAEALQLLDRREELSQHLLQRSSELKAETVGIATLISKLIA